MPYTYGMDANDMTVTATDVGILLGGVPCPGQWLPMVRAKLPGLGTLRPNGYRGAWHYSPIDVTALATYRALTEQKIFAGAEDAAKFILSLTQKEMDHSFREGRNTLVIVERVVFPKLLDRTFARQCLDRFRDRLRGRQLERQVALVNVEKILGNVIYYIKRRQQLKVRRTKLEGTKPKGSKT